MIEYSTFLALSVVGVIIVIGVFTFVASVFERREPPCKLIDWEPGEITERDHEESI